MGPMRAMRQLPTTSSTGRRSCGRQASGPWPAVPLCSVPGFLLFPQHVPCTCCLACTLATLNSMLQKRKQVCPGRTTLFGVQGVI